MDTVSGTSLNRFFHIPDDLCDHPPALIVGAFAERMKFSAVLIFLTLWFTFSYLPVWHMVWGGYLAEKWHAIDAGGTVVHINAGIAGLVPIVLGKRELSPSRCRRIMYLCVDWRRIALGRLVWF